MTTIINTIEKKFNLYDLYNYDYYDNNYLPYLEIKITILEKLYETNSEYYDISYDYKYHNDDKLSEIDKKIFYKNVHPFYDDMEHSDGVIVFKNTFTTTMIEYILMDDKELEKYSGLNTSQTYREILMKAMALLWD
jgi:hypothetical protein